MYKIVKNVEKLFLPFERTKQKQNKYNFIL